MQAVIRKPAGPGSTAAALSRITITLNNFDGEAACVSLRDVPALTIISKPSVSATAPSVGSHRSLGLDCWSAGPVTLGALRKALRGLEAAEAEAGVRHTTSDLLRAQLRRFGTTGGSAAAEVDISCAGADSQAVIVSEFKAFAIALSQACHVPCRFTELIGPLEERAVTAARHAAAQWERAARAQWAAAEAMRRAEYDKSVLSWQAEREGADTIVRAEWEAGEDDRRKARAEWEAAEAARRANESVMTKQRQQEAQQRRLALGRDSESGMTVSGGARAQHLTYFSLPS